MQIIHFKTEDRKNRTAFIQFPFKLYQDNPHWVPPIRMGIRKIFKPEYPFYAYGDAAFFLAKNNNGEVTGRLAVANNYRYNEFHHSKTALFYYFEVENDLQTAESLFSAGFNWAKGQGLNHIMGPKGFTVLDGFGMLIKGFEYQPAFGQPYNMPYYPDLMDSLGFTKVTDVFTGKIEPPFNLPEKVTRASKLVRKRLGLHSPLFRSKKELRRNFQKIKNLYNESLAGPAGNPLISDEDFNAMASQLMWIADPRLVKLLFKNEDAIGWLMAYPEIGAAIQKTKGRLFPFGWLHILRESKRTTRINLNGYGIVEDFQRMGGTAILFDELYKSATEISRYNYVEALQFREENVKSLLEVANFDIEFHKTHRLYEISI